MKKAIKYSGKKVTACRLGSGSPLEARLIEEGKVLRRPDGTFEIFSREATGGIGEIAAEGDYVKLDTGGWPYPNRREFFEAKHRALEEQDVWEQIPEPLSYWEADDPMCPEVRFLIEHKGLKIDSEDPERYFGAVLFGAPLTAARNAVLLFYRIGYAEDGSVEDADFNFVERGEFERTYRRIENA